jgi:hypothetical protein
MVGHQAGGARFLVGQFRVLVDVSAPPDYLLLDGRRALADLPFEGATVCTYRIRSGHQRCHRQRET